MHLRKSTKIILFILVLVAVVTAIVLSFIQKTPTTSIDTSQWKTYTNDHFGFTLKYPPTWKVTENPEASRIPKIPSSQPLHIVVIGSKERIFGINVLSGQDPLGIVSDPSRYRRASTTVDGENSLILSNDYPSMNTFVLVPHNRLTFMFDLWVARDFGEGEFREMLSSFNFTK